MDGAQIQSHVLAHFAIATRGSLDEDAVQILQADGKPIKLGLHGVLNLLHIQRLSHTFVKRPYILILKRVVQRKHRQAVRHRFEMLCWSAAYSLSG